MIRHTERCGKGQRTEGKARAPSHYGAGLQPLGLEAAGALRGTACSRDATRQTVKLVPVTKLLVWSRTLRSDWVQSATSRDRERGPHWGQTQYGPGAKAGRLPMACRRSRSQSISCCSSAVRPGMAVLRDQLRHRDAELFKALGDVGAGLAAAALPKTDVGNVTPQLLGERRPAQLVLLAIGA